MLREHRVHHGFRAVVNALQINLDHAIELILGHVLQLGVHDDAGVVHETIDASPAGRESHRPSARATAYVPHVGDAAEGLSACLLAQGQGSPRSTRESDRRRPPARLLSTNFDGRRLANAAPRAGDDRNLVLESHWIPVPPKNAVHKCSGVFRVAQRIPSGCAAQDLPETGSSPLHIGDEPAIGGVAAPRVKRARRFRPPDGAAQQKKTGEARPSRRPAHSPGRWRDG